MTNGDMIRQMGDKELFDNFIFKMDCGCWEDADECEKFWMSWLKQESEEKPREHIGILPVPCTKVEEETVKEWFHKINEKLDELKESILLDNQGMTVTCSLNTRAKYALGNEEEYLPMLVAEKAAGITTAIASMLEAMGINEEMRQEAQERVNRKNRERGRI